MKIGILSNQFTKYLEDRFTTVLKNFGHEIQFIQLSYCYMNISARAPTVYYRGNETFRQLKAIIPRIMRANTSYGSAVLRQFERMGVYTLNSSLSITWSRDKLRALQHLARKQLPMPITGFADSPEETEKLIELVGGAPLIVRLLEAPQGKGTVFAETHQAARSVINAFKQLKTGILIQEYIREAEGHDVRCIVIGHKVITSFQRNSLAEGIGISKENNSYGEIKPIKITPEEKKIVIAAAKAMKLNYASIDIIRSARGPLVLDIDPFPNIEMVEHFSKKDIVTPLIQFIEHDVKKHDGEQTIAN